MKGIYNVILTLKGKSFPFSWREFNSNN